MYGSFTKSFVDRFVARFEPSRDGFLYFHRWSSSGIACSQEEMLRLGERYSRNVRRMVGAVFVWAVVVCVGAAVMASVDAAPVSISTAFTLAMAPIPVMQLLLVNASNAPLKAFRGRAVATPPRQRGRVPWYESPTFCYVNAFVWAALFAIFVWDAGLKPEFVPLMGLNALMMFAVGFSRQSGL